MEKTGVTISDKDEKLQSIIMIDPRTPFIAPKTNKDGSIDLAVKGLNNRLTEIGFQNGDLIRVFNGAEIPKLSKENMGSLNMLFGASFSWTPEQEVTFEVEREEERITLSGTVGVAIIAAKGINAMSDVNPSQIALRKAWLHGK